MPGTRNVQQFRKTTPRVIFEDAVRARRAFREDRATAGGLFLPREESIKTFD
jgi:hypothetical protein